MGWSIPSFLIVSCAPVQESVALATIVVVVEPSSWPDSHGNNFSNVAAVAAARNVAESLQLPLLSSTAINEVDADAAGRRRKNHRRTAIDDPSSPDLYLTLEPYSYGDDGVLLEDYALSISQVAPDSTKTKPFSIDFWPPPNSPMARRRREEQQGGDDLLLKAIHPAATVIDATAGFGRDAWLMATTHTSSSNAPPPPRVIMVERHPIIAALLRDALRRLSLLAAHQQNNPAAADLSQRLSLVEMDALDYLLTKVSVTATASSSPPTTLPDVVYLDPMFPPRRKSAAVKKNMQILHTLLASSSSSAPATDEESAIEAAAVRDDDDGALLRAARLVARTRVVVKRPIHAAPIRDDTGPPPSGAITGSISRWDIYTTTTAASTTKSNKNNTSK
jgi:16S rRNA (guanine1516-N2)-methyltransferase